MRAFHFAGLLSIAVVPMLCSGSMGSPIDFSTSGAISGPTDVHANGTVVQAYDFHNAGNLSVNGVSFSNFPGTSGDTSGIVDAGALPGFAGPNPQGFSGDFYTLMNNAAVDDGVTSNTLVLNGLSSGQKYQVEIITYDGRYPGHTSYREDMLTGDVGGTPGADFYQGNGTTVPFGSYVIGTFTADSSSQTITFTSNSSFGNADKDLQINALVVSALPEPASMGLIAFSAIGLLKRRRR